MIESLRGQFKRANDSPVSGSLSLDDDTETTIVDFGTLGGSFAYRVQTAVIDVTLNSHSSVTVRVKSSINGAIATGSEHTYNSAQITDIFGDLNPDRITGNRVAITIEGSNAAPTTAAVVDYSVSYTVAQ